jgi:nucleotide-binding universal stress UspA family protein
MAGFKVLVPLDGSRTAEHALVYLDALGPLGPLDVRLVSVVETWPEAGKQTLEEARERERNLLSTYLREVASDLRRHSRVDVDADVIEGTPATALLDEAETFAPDVLIIATHGRTGPSRWRLGSVADKVIRGASCDVLVVGPRAAERERWLEARVEDPFKSILVPLDGSQLAEKALQRAQSLAATFGSTLHLVNAVTLPVVPDATGGSYEYTGAALEQMTEGSEQYLKQMAAGLIAGTAVVTKVAVGGAPAMLEQYSRDNSIGLIVMTTHGRGGLMRAALGSVTDRMLANAVAPVWVVRATA